jgi:hypothetical protein
MRISISLAAVSLAIVFAARSFAGERAPLSAERFEKLHAQLKRQPSESRWMELDWYPSVWEGRQKAAAEGKPLFLWAGSGGAPAAGC